jgi:hypothetical protein
VVDALLVTCNGSIEVVEGFVAGVEMEFQQAAADFVAISKEAVTDYLLEVGSFAGGIRRGSTLGDEGPVQGDCCLSMET